MKKYAVQVLKEEKVSEKEFRNDDMVRKSFSKFDEHILHEDLSKLSQDRISQLLNRFFKKYTRRNVNTSVEFEARERVLVNEVGKWKVDQAVYDKKTRIPKHLRQPLKVKNDG